MVTDIVPPPQKKRRQSALRLSSSLLERREYVLYSHGNELRLLQSDKDKTKPKIFHHEQHTSVSSDHIFPSLK